MVLGVASAQIYAETEVTPTNCDEPTGKIKAIMKNHYTYVRISKNNHLTLPRPVCNGLKEFTVECLFRFTNHYTTQNQLNSSRYTALIGQDNTLECGFRYGKPAFYVTFTKTNNSPGFVDFTCPNPKRWIIDNNWHHFAVRGDGNKIELIIDGVIEHTEIVSYKRLRVDGVTKNPTVGDKVWGSTQEKAFNGYIARFSFWNRALTNQELNAMRDDILLSNDDQGLITACNVDRINPSNYLQLRAVGTKAANCTLMFRGQWRTNTVIYKLTGNKNYLSYNGEFNNLPKGTYTLEYQYCFSSSRFYMDSKEIYQKTNIQVPEYPRIKTNRIRRVR